MEFIRLAELGGAASLRRRIEWASSLDADLRRAFLAIVEHTTAESNRLIHHPLEPPQLAFVARLHGITADVRLEGSDASVPLPIPDLELLDSAFVSAALALRFERIGVGQTLLTAAPAIKLDDGDDSWIYPYERPLPDAGAPAAPAAAVAGAPTIRRPRRIPIARQR